MSTGSARLDAAQAPSDPEQQPPAEQAERRRWPGFWLWLVTTLILLALIGALLWHLSTREPQIVEVVGETPPPLEPAPELVAKAAELRQKIALRQNQLNEAMLALDPPRCEPPKVPDQELLDKVRAAEADNLRRWRSLLVPLDPALPQSRPSTEAPEVAPSPSQSVPTTPEADEPAPLKRQSSAEQVPQTQAQAPTPGGLASRLTTAALSEHLEKSSVIVIGLPSKGGTGLSTGTGFFISPTTIVTNRHVIEKADPKSIYVTSKAFNTIQHARLVARTLPGSPGQLDFAVLELNAGRAPAHVELASNSSKLTEVVAAGYPGMALKTDSGFRELLQGDITSAPDLNMNRGEIRSVRQLGQITQIIHTADVLQGYSGGPLMDECGRVVGVNTFIQVDQTQAAKLNNAIAISDLVSFLGREGVPVEVDGRACPAE